MRRRLLLTLALLALIILPGGTARAGGRVSVGIGFGVPFYRPYYPYYYRPYYAYGVYVAPPPVYVVPASTPRYVQPAPAVYAPVPVQPTTALSPVPVQPTTALSPLPVQQTAPSPIAPPAPAPSPSPPG